jgi:hypothetical protein
MSRLAYQAGSPPFHRNASSTQTKNATIAAMQAATKPSAFFNRVTTI